MELKITNDDFKVEILDNDKKKTINASYDIFDFDDKDSKDFPWRKGDGYGIGTGYKISRSNLYN